MILGNPSNAESSADNYLIERAQYVMSYNKSMNRANWVAWHLNKSWLGDAERTNAFMPDLALPDNWHLPTKDSYRNSGFDQGHLCPSADRTASQEDNAATFLFSNVIPQNPAFNRKAWKHFENYCRQLAQIGNELYIFSGTIGVGGNGNDGYKLTIDNIAVPSALWKVILVIPDGDDDLCRIDDKTYVLGIIIPNHDVDDNWNNYIFSVDEIEAVTDLNLFSTLPKAIQEKLEK